MRLWKLWAVMILTFLGMVGVTALFIAPILMALGTFTPLALASIVFVWVFIEWLISPKLIEALYNVRPVPEWEYRWLHEALERVKVRSGYKKPIKLMIADMPIPNAFAYGSLLTGPRVAVTRGLLNTLDRGEVEAVLGHEVGHLRHRDVQIAMTLSVLPALVYMIATTLYYAGWFGSWSDREEGGGGMILMAMGMLGFLIYFILNLLLLAFSRQREYYADFNGANVVDGGALKLASALVKISNASSRVRNMGVKKDISSYSRFKALLILDPEAAQPVYFDRGRIEVVKRVARREITLAEKFAELFSTHPNIVKRLRFLLRLGGIEE